MSLVSLLDVPAPAKLNLFLHITGRRADGYHLLQSVFVLIDWADTLHFERRADGRLQRHDLGPALPADDLSLRAARLLQQRSGCSLGVDISVDKQVPWGAGMGGGSSDAATTLLALNRLWGLGWSRAQLLALAPQLGADVPFFVGGDNAFVEGIGEQLSPIEVPVQRFVVVKPQASLATAEIFAHPLLTRDTKLSILRGSLADTAFGRNDLQPPAEDRCPEVAQAARWLADRFGNSRMTGSGSAVFARMDTGTNASPSAIDLTDLPAGWVGRECRSLASHPLRAWAD
ncbi:4-(cytidine 5'-diphospho)-2-C-methyl-D-erythritol kinase [Aquincola tertiaricarbonis]|uniref:4-(cytidine 5'-diphospho)-2-C-methyl-D-erythritol kinase n=1 Tax=Aquincola tertiaricarbonis TaxID=391953 RepID=UPI0009F8FABD